MAALKLNSGDDNTVRFTVTDADGTAINLTSGTIRFKIAKSINVTDVNALYVGSYTSFTNPAGGIHDEVIPDATTNSWTAGDYQYQARFITSAGIVQSDVIDNVVIQQNLLDDE